MIASRRVGASLAQYIREVQAARERYRARFATREERGVNLLREWLSPEQRAQFDAKRYFDVIGCDSGKRYRIHYGETTNVHEIGDDDLPAVGWCFMPVGSLVVGDVMLAQKIALETYEYGALAVANRCPIRFSRFR
ncbi:hypothetical protein [Bradyrhizobium erythrophlei]|uniref:hypothetical protein n=1 Tax=Bradyrhizobium erythrophlei TaxID=1437360 RepID=UPI003CC7F05B